MEAIIGKKRAQVYGEEVLVLVLSMQRPPVRAEARSMPIRKRKGRVVEDEEEDEEEEEEEEEREEEEKEEMCIGLSDAELEKECGRSGGTIGSENGSENVTHPNLGREGGGEKGEEGDSVVSRRKRRKS